LLALAVLAVAVAAWMFGPSAGPQKAAEAFLEALAAGDAAAVSRAVSPESQRWLQLPPVETAVQYLCSQWAEQKATYQIGEPKVRGRRADIPVTVSFAEGEPQKRALVAEKVRGGWRIELLGTLQELAQYDAGADIDAYMQQELLGRDEAPADEGQ
jgi:hypothetical protein